MNEVYVLSGREILGNSEWGGCTEIYIFGVYEEFEKAKNAFKNKILEIAKDLVDSEDGFFKYTEDTIFENSDADEETFGWEYFESEKYCQWELYLPENDDYDIGFWLIPIVVLRKYEIE